MQLSLTFMLDAIDMDHVGKAKPRGDAQKQQLKTYRATHDLSLEQAKIAARE